MKTNCEENNDQWIDYPTIINGKQAKTRLNKWLLNGKTVHDNFELVDAISQKAGAKTMDLVPQIKKNAQLAQDIAAASYEQTSGVEQVNSAIQQLNQVTQQNAAASEEMASSAEELNCQADQLKELVSYFKIKNEK